jgi:benzil reductase ((S)-benzoin forming)
LKKVIIITGGNKGLGKALIDIGLKDADTFIISVSRNLHEDHVSVDSSKMILIKTDLSESFSADIFTEIEKYITPQNRVYFFNNAGIILPINDVGNLESKAITTSLKVNVEFPVNFINMLLGKFTEHKMILVNISSGAGNNPVPYWSLYGGAKAYMKLFFKVLEKENAENRNLQFYEIDPGVLDTEMQQKIREATAPKQGYFTSLKTENKLTSPEDAAQKIFNEIQFYV